jgi:hypothetical protein
VWGNDREMMTSDAGGGVYSGHVKAQAAGSTVVTLATPAHGTQPGGAMCALRSTAATCHTLPAQPYQFKTGLQHKKFERV